MERLEGAISEVAPNASAASSKSSGGLMSVDKALEFPVRTALPGPAAGAVGAAAAGGKSSIGDIITLDIGGTNTDVCLNREKAFSASRMRANAMRLALTALSSRRMAGAIDSAPAPVQILPAIADAAGNHIECWSIAASGAAAMW